MIGAGAGVRSQVLAIWDTLRLAHDLAARAWYLGEERRGSNGWRGALSLIRYGCDHPSRKRRTRMDVQEMVRRWVPIVVGLSTAHTKDELDRCEFEMEEHLAPLLVAPVAQLRQFYTELAAACEGDPRVPMFVWSTLRAWDEVVVRKAPDEEVRELKDALAREIADLVEKAVQPDVKEAIAGALRWRRPEVLEKVKEAVVAGGKPKLRGRESCLFLSVEVDGRPMKVDGEDLQVML